MISLVNDGVLNWAVVISIAYLVLVLLGTDLAWRRTKIRARQLIASAGTIAVVGSIVILSVLG